MERLEREVLVARNRADVNALFKDEHDRIASELVQTKMLWAEAQVRRRRGAGRCDGWHAERRYAPNPSKDCVHP